MPNNDARPGETQQKSEYLVVPNRKKGGSPEDLTALAKAATDRSDVEVKLVGPAERPSRLKLAATAKVITELRERFGERLIIERDQPLQY